MKHYLAALSLVLLVTCSLSGCSDADPQATTAVTAGTEAQPAADAPVDAAAPLLTACELVTAQEMSSIVGSTLTAEPEERPSNAETTCSYKKAESLSPDVTFTLNRGHGEAAMVGMGMMSQAEPGIADPYEGLGDHAATVGPQLWIRTGDDLVKLTILGFDNVPDKARQILDTAKPRM